MLTEMLPLIFITKLNLGGIERICTTLCNEWSRQGRRFLLYVSYDGGEMRQAIQAQDNIFVSNTPARYSVWKLFRLCKQHPDSPLLVLNAEIGVVLLLLRCLRAINHRILFVESTAIFSHCSWWWLYLYRVFISQADGFIAQSKKGVASLEKLFPVGPRARIIYNPCEFVNVESPSSFLTRTEEGRNFLIVSRLAPMKGHMRLLAAFCGMESNRWRLTIAGDGECREEISDEVKRLGVAEHVNIVGSVMDVRPLYEKADIFVMASEYEGLPNTLIEAIACGCRVLVVAGEGGTTEFMQTIGLGDFVFSEKDFVSRFEWCFQKVEASDLSLWSNAYQRMSALVHPVVVANQIWSFLKGDE